MKNLNIVMFILGLLFTTQASYALAPGDTIADFSAQNQDGKTVNYANMKGKAILFYFYPKDETPGCTKEACSFRDNFSKFKEKGILVYGISGQDLKSHKQFAEKYHLPFDLLDDSKGALQKSFGIEKIPVIGFYKRQSVLVGQNGKVLKIYKDVDPKVHADEVLKDLELMNYGK